MSPSSELIRLLDVAVRTSFQSLRDVYFLRLEICTFAVVIGVFIEEGEYFLSWPRIRQKVPLRLLLPTHRFDKWVRRLSKVGWILILLGVAQSRGYLGYTGRDGAPPRGSLHRSNRPRRPRPRSR